MTIAVCDNEKAELDIIDAMLREWLGEREEEAEILLFRDPVELKRRAMSGEIYDMYIMDVTLHGTSGIEIGRIVRARSEYTPIVYLTRSKNHALEAYSVNAIRYLLKPLKYSELDDAMKFARLICAAAPRSMIKVRLPGAVANINADDVLYIENNVRNMRYVMADGSVLNGTRRNISFEAALAPLLESGRFVQSHKSFIINIRYIKELRTTNVLMSNGVAVPISRRHVTEVHDAYAGFLAAAR